MSDLPVDADTMPPNFGDLPTDIVPILGSPDPLVQAPVSPNVDDRLAANEAANADLQRRVADIETGGP